MNDLLESYKQQDEGYSSTEHAPADVTAATSKLKREATGVLVTETGGDGHEQVGTITLVGSGPGDPNLLTLSAHQAIKDADLVLSDKIVPAEVIALVECELKIARKFPGNADAAQHEFNALALVELKQGKKVVRLKQGGMGRKKR
jgi:uroporphyrin-III C-methyltransferase